MDAAKHSRRQTQRRALWLTAALSLIAFAALVAATLRLAASHEQSRHESVRQADLNLRLRQMQAVLAAVVSAESGQRGYLLTGDPKYLAPYREAMVELPTLLDGLSNIPVDPQTIEPRVRAIRELTAAKLDELAEVLREHDAGQHEAALARVRGDLGRRLMVQLRDELQATTTPNPRSTMRSPPTAVPAARRWPWRCSARSNSASRSTSSCR